MTDKTKETQKKGITSIEYWIDQALNNPGKLMRWTIATTASKATGLNVSSDHIAMIGKYKIKDTAMKIMEGGGRDVDKVLKAVNQEIKNMGDREKNKKTFESDIAKLENLAGEAMGVSQQEFHALRLGAEDKDLGPLTDTALGAIKSAVPAQLHTDFGEGIVPELKKTQAIGKTTLMLSQNKETQQILEGIKDLEAQHEKLKQVEEKELGLIHKEMDPLIQERKELTKKLHEEYDSLMTYEKQENKWNTPQKYYQTKSEKYNELSTQIEKLETQKIKIEKEYREFKKAPEGLKESLQNTVADAVIKGGLVYEKQTDKESHASVRKNHDMTDTTLKFENQVQEVVTELDTIKKNYAKKIHPREESKPELEKTQLDKDIKREKDEKSARLDTQIEKQKHKQEVEEAQKKEGFKPSKTPASQKTHTKDWELH